MTLDSTQRDAERLITVILERVAVLTAEHGMPTQAIRLAIYPTAHDFRYLRPGDPWSWEHHTAVVRAVARKLKRHHLKIALTDCTAEGCAAWLDAKGMIGTTQNRSAYVASITG